ncbi:Ig-like domain-containing protein [Enterobacter hormaechei]
MGTGKAGSDGNLRFDLGTPLTNGEEITATATDPSGNTSPGVQVGTGFNRAGCTGDCHRQ